MPTPPPECENCHAPLQKTPEGDCANCKRREAVRRLIRLLEPGSLARTVLAAAEAVRETLVHDALLATEGHRLRAAERLGTVDERVAEAMRRYPHLRKAFPSTYRLRGAPKP